MILDWWFQEESIPGDMTSEVGQVLWVEVSQEGPGHLKEHLKPKRRRATAQEAASMIRQIARSSERQYRINPDGLVEPLSPGMDHG